MRQSAEAILLNPDRKPIYDQTLAVYRTVALLRRRLSLERTELWDRESLASLHPWYTSRRPSHDRRRRMILAFVLLVLPITIGLVLLLQFSLPPSVQSPTPSHGSTDAIPTPHERLTPETATPANTVADSYDTILNSDEPAVTSDDVATNRQPLPEPLPWQSEDAMAEYRQRRYRPIKPAATPDWNTATAAPMVSTMTRSLGDMIPKGECELLVTAPSHRHVFVKIIDSINRDLCTPVFIPKGRSMILRVPPGLYELLFALGDRWYGWEFDFGPTAAYMGTQTGIQVTAGSGPIAFDFTDGVPVDLRTLSRGEFD